MTLGDSVKVWLPGETPWAEVVALHDDETWDGRILNRLVPEMDDLEHARLMKGVWGTGRRLARLHSHKQGDVVRFRREVTPDYEIWVPADCVERDLTKMEASNG
jgi:hypothetical protein